MCQIKGIYPKQNSKVPLGVRNSLSLFKEVYEAMEEQHHPTTESDKNLERFQEISTCLFLAISETASRYSDNVHIAFSNVMHICREVIYGC
jgi:hypothetical protein